MLVMCYQYNTLAELTKLCLMPIDTGNEPLYIAGPPTRVQKFRLRVVFTRPVVSKLEQDIWLAAEYDVSRLEP